jgi:hypothetical protein
MERIRQVLKLVTIEGDFSEIVSYKDIRPVLFNVFQAEKKALITVSAKAMVGFDLTKVEIIKNENSRTISIKSVPEPEIISIDSDIKYYDISNNLLTSFKPDDYTKINQIAKDNIRMKIPESGLYENAINQAKVLMNGLEQIAERLNWNLDYSTLLSLPEAKAKKIAPKPDDSTDSSSA